MRFWRCCVSKSGFAVGDLLFFASPKKSKQKKGDPDFALFPENHLICLTEKLSTRYAQTVQFFLQIKQFSGGKDGENLR
ncbi:hypothetical protein [Lonepinella sp. BR2930]|uniref:hypothetical protein n=1 Tax=Lonepinella sp. BR2930 TaxID=3434554 RepID=UPI003F6E1153